MSRMNINNLLSTDVHFMQEDDPPPTQNPRQGAGQGAGQNTGQAAVTGTTPAVAPSRGTATSADSMDQDTPSGGQSNAPPQAIPTSTDNMDQDAPTPQAHIPSQTTPVTPQQVSAPAQSTSAPSQPPGSSGGLQQGPGSMPVPAANVNIPVSSQLTPGGQGPPQPQPSPAVSSGINASSVLPQPTTGNPVQPQTGAVNQTLGSQSSNVSVANPTAAVGGTPSITGTNTATAVGSGQTITLPIHPAPGSAPVQTTANTGQGGTGGTTTNTVNAGQGGTANTAATTDNTGQGGSANTATAPTTTQAVTAVDPRDGVFTRLHMIQAGRGDTLLLEFRQQPTDPVQYWLIDGGDIGRRYSLADKFATERLFQTLNTFPRKDQPASTSQSTTSTSQSTTSTSQSTTSTSQPATSTGNRGLEYLDRIIVTHPDVDHIKGIDSILRSLLPSMYIEDVQNSAPLPNRREFYSWTAGAISTRKSKLPFGKIWYNDNACIRANLPLANPVNPNTTTNNNSTSTTVKTLQLGWMVDDLDSEDTSGLRPAWAKHGVDIPKPETYLNDEFLGTGSTRSVTQFHTELKLVSATGLRKFGMLSRERYAELSNTKRSELLPAIILSPGEEQLVTVAAWVDKEKPGMDYSKVRKPPTTDSTIQLRKIGKWPEDMDILNIKSAHSDASVTNAMSIGFSFNVNGKKSLLTGDSTGTLIKQGLSVADQTQPFTLWDIVKIPHHGSCYNCYLLPPTAAKSNQFDRCRQFFKYFKARTYCFSSDPFSGHPNPDIYTMAAVVDGYCDWTNSVRQVVDPPADWLSTWRNLNIVLTNGCSKNSWQVLNARALENKINLTVSFMNPNAPYCTTDAGTGPESAGLTVIAAGSQFDQMYRAELVAYARVLRGELALSGFDNNKPLTQADYDIMEKYITQHTYDEVRSQTPSSGGDGSGGKKRRAGKAGLKKQSDDVLGNLTSGNTTPTTVSSTAYVANNIATNNQNAIHVFNPNATTQPLAQRRRGDDQYTGFIFNNAVYVNGNFSQIPLTISKDPYGQYSNVPSNLYPYGGTNTQQGGYPSKPPSVYIQPSSSNLYPSGVTNTQQGGYPSKPPSVYIQPSSSNLYPSGVTNTQQGGYPSKPPSVYTQPSTSSGLPPFQFSNPQMGGYPSSQASGGTPFKAPPTFTPSSTNPGYSSSQYGSCGPPQAYSNPQNSYSNQQGLPKNVPAPVSSQLPSNLGTSTLQSGRNAYQGQQTNTNYPPQSANYQSPSASNIFLNSQANPRNTVQLSGNPMQSGSNIFQNQQQIQGSQSLPSIYQPQPVSSLIPRQQPSNSSNLAQSNPSVSSYANFMFGSGQLSQQSGLNIGQPNSNFLSSNTNLSLFGGSKGFNSFAVQASPASQRPFLLPCDIGFNNTTKSLMAQADQGSELNLITSHFVESLCLKRYSLGEAGYSSSKMKMRTADLREIFLESCVSVIVTVAGISRQTWCFVNPTMAHDTEDGGSAQLLLGLPWLYDVNAVIRARAFSMEIGDPANGEQVQNVIGPQYHFSAQHNLLLYPQDANPENPNSAEPLKTVQVYAATPVDENTDSNPAQSLNGHEAVPQVSSQDSSQAGLASSMENNAGTANAQGEEVAPSNNATSQDVPSASQTNGAPAARQPSVEDTLAQIWHCLTVSEFSIKDMPSLQYFSDSPPPSTSLGSDATCVDLPQFLGLLKTDNAISAAQGSPMFSEQSFQQLATWFPGNSASIGGSDAILGVFLTAFMGVEAATHIMTALPLSPGGPASNAMDPAVAATMLSVTSKLPMYNVRWEVVPPSSDGKSRLKAISCYFELCMPSNISDGSETFFSNGMPPGLSFSWVVPFSNATTSHGAVNLVHDPVRGLRIKLLWPLNQNRSMIGQFNSVFILAKAKPGQPNKELVTLPCAGTVYMKSLKDDCMANYDIQFGDMDLLDAFDHFSPLQGKFQTILGDVVEKLGVNKLTDYIQKAVTLKLRNVGIVFRQVTPQFSAVCLDQLYGTIDPADCKTTLDLPGVEWKLPVDDLPATTLKIGNIGEKSNHTASIAFSKGLSDLGFFALEGSFSISKWRPEFDATVLCQEGVSLGEILERGMDIIEPHFMDNDMLSCLHVGSFNPKAVADIGEDVLNEIMVPWARIQVAKLPSNSFGITELELNLQLKPIQFPAEEPFIELKDFELQILQQRFGGAPSSASSGAPIGASTGTSSAPPGSSTSVIGKASLNLAGIDANITFAYDPSEDLENRLALNPQPPSSGRKIVLELDFPNVEPAIGDIINQVVGEASKLASGGSCAARIPAPLLDILDVAAFEVLQITVASDQQENSPWHIFSVYARVDLNELADIINIFGDALQFEHPWLTARVDYPTMAAKRSFDLQISSFIAIGDILCDIYADISFLKNSDGSDSNSIAFGFSWDPAKGSLSLGNVLGLLVDEIADEVLGVTQGESYIDALRNRIPENLKQLIDSIDLQYIKILVADFSSDPNKHDFGLATIFAQVTAFNQPWSPFGDGWGHLSFQGASLVFAYYSGKTLGSSANTAAPGQAATSNSKGATTVSFATQMNLASCSLEIQLSYSNTPTGLTVSLVLSEAPTENYTLLDLIAEMVGDVVGVKSITIPDEAKRVFDISLQSLSIVYSKTTSTAGPVESLSFTQSGGATLLGVDFASIAIMCTRTAGVWGYDVQFKLEPQIKPFAKILPVPGIEDLTIVNGEFDILKGPATGASKIVRLASTSGGNGTSIFLSGGLQLGGNDFMDLVHTIVKVPEIDFALQTNGTLTVEIPVGKLELIVAGYPMFSVENFLLQVSQGNIYLSAEMDFLCQWLAPSIKDHPIGFRFALGIGLDGSLDISLYAVDPATGQQYPDMSEDHFIVRPFYIPGLILYPFHFSMRWNAEEELPEALAAGGGFAIEGTPISAVFAFSVDEENPLQNYIRINIQDLTLGSMFGVLFPHNEEMSKIFSVVDMGFNALDLNLYPAQRQFHLYADMVYYFFRAKIIADVDPLAGIMMSATMNPIDLGNGLIKLVSYDTPNKGPFIHINTNVKAIVTGQAPQNPQTPEWASVTSGDPRLDDSFFALTAKIHFLAIEVDVFGLVDTTGLVLKTYQGIGVNLPDLAVSFSRQLDISISESQFYVMAACKFDIEFDIPSIHIGGVKLGSFPHESISLDISISLTIRYDKSDWLNDGLVYEGSFDVDILGLHLDVPHMEIEVTVKEFKDLPAVVEHYIRDKVIDFLEHKLVDGVEEIGHDVEKVGKEAIHVLSHEFNVAEQDVAHAMTEVGQDVEHTAANLRHDLGMGLDETVKVFVNIGHDISHFGDAVAQVFSVSKAEVIASAVLQGACSLEHAITATLGRDIDDLKHFGSDIAGFATELGSIANRGLDDLETAARHAEQDIVHLGHTVESGVEQGFHAIEKGGKELGNDLKKGGEELGNDFKKGAEAGLHFGEHVINSIKKHCSVM